jgi:hypothetical protein
MESLTEGGTFAHQSGHDTCHLFWIH